MTPEHRLAVIMTIHALQIGRPVSKGLVAILLEPWPDLCGAAAARDGVGWINLLQAPPLGSSMIGWREPMVLTGRHAEKPGDLRAAP